MEASVWFFFEKKNQKTFARYEARGRRGAWWREKVTQPL